MPSHLQDGLCHYEDTKKRVQISSYTNVTGEMDLKMALFNKGAVAVNIDASHKSLSFYESGVYFEPDCSECRVPFKSYCSCSVHARAFFNHLNKLGFFSFH